MFAGWATYRAPRLTSVIWWSFTATIFVSAALIILLPGELRGRLLWSAFFIPVAWVAVQFWCYWESRPGRVAVTLIAATVVGMLVVLFTEPIL